MTNGEASNILRAEAEHISQHLKEKGKAPDYYQELGDYVIAVYQAIDALNKMDKYYVTVKALEVIDGKYGNGYERKQRLGDEYDIIQKRVNEIIINNTWSRPKRRKPLFWKIF